jgi:hypothetical protein
MKLWQMQHLPFKDALTSFNHNTQPVEKAAIGVDKETMTSGDRVLTDVLGAPQSYLVADVLGVVAASNPKDRFLVYKNGRPVGTNHDEPAPQAEVLQTVRLEDVIKYAPVRNGSRTG